MKNKVELKNLLLKVLIVSICFLSLFLLINIYEYKVYTKNFNNKINSIVNILQEKYPNISEKEIIEILNNNENDNLNILKKYGITLNDKSIVIKNEEKYHEFLVINVFVLVCGIVILVAIFSKYIKKREKDINDITKYIEELNKKNYSLKIDSNSEDELSILKNEICKTTIMLKEIAEISKKDKLDLKASLEDISHQLKTPITSILVILDNLIDDPDMESEVRKDFILEIKRQIFNINFFIQEILKLSKFETNTILFNREEVLLKDIVNEAKKSVSILCDLRNISININCDENVKILCDFKWQVEAITNILKNGIEHSDNNQSIDIKCGKYNVYSYIEIKDYGKGISKKDLKHIFERFYNGENSSSESTGIGLALTKAIVEKDNGNIFVYSNKDGTKFVIKYFH